jgi:hypothetical protein
MTFHQHWRVSYHSALQACGKRDRQKHEADRALCACTRRLSETSQLDSTERLAIRTALDDLILLKILYRRYG